MTSNTLPVLRAAIGRAYRANDGDALNAARSAYAEAKIADAISKSLEKAPALSADQISRLSALLGGAA